jgi:hypothetical protein
LTGEEEKREAGASTQQRSSTMGPFKEGDPVTYSTEENKAYGDAEGISLPAGKHFGRIEKVDEGEETYSIRLYGTKAENNAATEEGKKALKRLDALSQKVITGVPVEALTAKPMDKLKRAEQTGYKKRVDRSVYFGAAAGVLRAQMAPKVVVDVFGEKGTNGDKKRSRERDTSQGSEEESGGGSGGGSLGGSRSQKSQRSGGSFLDPLQPGGALAYKPRVRPDQSILETSRIADLGLSNLANVEGTVVIPNTYAALGQIQVDFQTHETAAITALWDQMIKSTSPNRYLTECESVSLRVVTDRWREYVLGGTTAQNVMLAVPMILMDFFATVKYLKPSGLSLAGAAETPDAVSVAPYREIVERLQTDTCRILVDEFVAPTPEQAALHKSNSTPALAAKKLQAVLQKIPLQIEKATQEIKDKVAKDKKQLGPDPKALASAIVQAVQAVGGQKGGHIGGGGSGAATTTPTKQGGGQDPTAKVHNRMNWFKNGVAAPTGGRTGGRLATATEGWIYAQLAAHFDGADTYDIPVNVLSNEKAREFYKQLDRNSQYPP